MLEHVKKKNVTLSVAASQLTRSLTLKVQKQCYFFQTYNYNFSDELGIKIFNKGKNQKKLEAKMFSSIWNCCRKCLSLRGDYVWR